MERFLFEKGAERIMNQEPKQDEILRILTEKPEKKKRQKIRPGDWFYNNRFVMVFSIVISLALWLLMAYNDTQRNPVIVSNVPISVTLPETLQQKRAQSLRDCFRCDCKSWCYRHAHHRLCFEQHKYGSGAGKPFRN